MNWYAIYTHSTFEKRVKRDIEHRASIEGLRDKLGQIVIPGEKFVEVKEGKKKEFKGDVLKKEIKEYSNNDGIKR